MAETTKSTLDNTFIGVCSDCGGKRFRGDDLHQPQECVRALRVQIDELRDFIAKVAMNR